MWHQRGKCDVFSECVADYTVMLMLMSIRKMKRIMQREESMTFASWYSGKEMPSFTVGVIGTGRIGRAVIRDISGFGCQIYAYDQYENDEVKKYAQYASLDEIYEKCDMITLHMPLTKENMHLIDAEAIQKMQDGVVLINYSEGRIDRYESVN